VARYFRLLKWTNVTSSRVHFLPQILEPRFTAESLAALLSIPTSKTLLRRHLATHFQSLVGTECHQVKEEAAADPMFQPLMPGIKHKVASNTIHVFIASEFLKCFTNNTVHCLYFNHFVHPNFCNWPGVKAVVNIIQNKKEWRKKLLPDRFLLKRYYKNLSM